MRIKAVWFSLILSLFTQFAMAADCGPLLDTRPLSMHFHTLMARQELIHQTDVRLGQRQLLVPGGGLCASTCGANIVHAMLSYTQSYRADFKRMADYYVHRIVYESGKAYLTDGRLGLSLKELALGIVVLGRELGLKVFTDEHIPSSYRPLRLEHLAPEKNELLVASVCVGQREGKDMYHAVVLTTADVAKGQVFLSDPNFPNSGEWSPAIPYYDGGGNLTVRLEVKSELPPSANNGLIQSLLRVRIATPSDLMTTMPPLAAQVLSLDLTDRWMIVSNGAKKFPRFMERIKTDRRNPFDRFGYVVSFIAFGTSYREILPFESVKSLQLLSVALGPARFRQAVGNKIKIEWAPSVREAWTEVSKQEIFQVVSYDPEDRSYGFPQGSLTVISLGPFGIAADLEKIPLEFIQDFKLFGR